MNIKILGDINPDDQALLNCEHINIITDDNDTNIELLLVYDNVIMVYTWCQILWNISE